MHGKENSVSFNTKAAKERKDHKDFFKIRLQLRIFFTKSFCDLSVS